MSLFAPIPFDSCSGCGRGTEDYYLRRSEHMATAFRSGVPVPKIAGAYGVSPAWTMDLIEKQLGREAVLEVHEMYRVEV